MNWLDLFDDGAIGENARYMSEERERRHGPTEGDIETVAPFIGMCPDESEEEEGSPLDFGRPHSAHIGTPYTYLKFKDYK
jgi:hypothetical protein